MLAQGLSNDNYQIYQPEYFLIERKVPTNNKNPYWFSLERIVMQFCNKEYLAGFFLQNTIEYNILTILRESQQKKKHSFLNDIQIY